MISDIQLFIARWPITVVMTALVLGLVVGSVAGQHVEHSEHHEHQEVEHGYRR